MFGFLKHLFLPHEKNNHRAKILHNSSFFVILLLILTISIVSYSIKNIRPDILGISYSISDAELLSLVNRERETRSLPPLALNPQLSDAARRKAADMYAKNYWAHFAPDGSTSPWAFIKATGYNYSYAGENLAKGFTDPSSIVSAWMDSQTHRDNILNSRYQDVGFAIVPGTLSGEETVLVVEMLGATSSRTLAVLTEGAEGVASVQEQTQQSSGSAPTAVSPAQAGSFARAQSAPKIDAEITSAAISTVGLSFLAFAFMMDLIIVERKKIPRIVGHNIDHIMLILMFLLFLVLRGGVII